MGGLGAQNVNLAVEVAEPVHRGALGGGERGLGRLKPTAYSLPPKTGKKLESP